MVYDKGMIAENPLKKIDSSFALSIQDARFKFISRQGNMIYHNDMCTIGVYTKYRLNDLSRQIYCDLSK